MEVVHVVKFVFLLLIEGKNKIKKHFLHIYKFFVDFLFIIAYNESCRWLNNLSQ